MQCLKGVFATISSLQLHDCDSLPANLESGVIKLVVHAYHASLSLHVLHDEIGTYRTLFDWLHRYCQ